MIQCKKDLETQLAVTDLVVISKNVISAMGSIFGEREVVLTAQLPNTAVRMPGDQEKLELMLTIVLTEILEGPGHPSEMLFVLASGETGTQISVCDNGSQPAVTGFGQDNKIAHRFSGKEMPGMDYATTVIQKHNGSIRLLKSGIPYNQLLIEFPTLHATKD